MKYLFVLIFVGMRAFGDIKGAHTPSNGRFQLIQLSEFRRDQYLLDTQTGQLWNMSCESSQKGSEVCTYQVWFKQDIEGLNTSLNEISRRSKIYRKQDAPVESN